MSAAVEDQADRVVPAAPWGQPVGEQQTAGLDVSPSSSSISRPTASRGDSPTSTTPPGRSQSRL